MLDPTKPYLDCIGKKFNGWTVIQDEGHDIYGKRRVRVKCDCGNQAIIFLEAVKHGRSKLCGSCSSKRRAGTRSNNSNWSGYGRVGATEYHSIVRNATVKGYELNVTIEYLDDLLTQQNEKCALTGIPLVVHKGKGNGNASLDRIDSTKGYIVGNVQWVDKRINFMKGRITQGEFVELCRLVYLNKEREDERQEDACSVQRSGDASDVTSSCGGASAGEAGQLQSGVQGPR